MRRRCSLSFKLAGKEFDDAISLRQAQNAINSAESAVSDAGNKLGESARRHREQGRQQ
jgi:hypothetical protein